LRSLKSGADLGGSGQILTIAGENLSLRKE
jgi:hypothetical protein